MLFQHRLTAAALPRSPIPCQSPAAHPHFGTQRFRGNHVCGPVQESSVRFDAGNGAPGFVVACGERGLHARAAASLLRRCVSSLQLRNSRRRPRHGLHDQETGPAHTGLSGVFQTVRARVCGQGGDASQPQPGGRAKAQTLAACRTTISATTPTRRSSARRIFTEGFPRRSAAAE